MSDRGLSTVVGYALALGIVALLTSALFVTMAGFVEHQREDTARVTLEVVGNELAADLETVDRLSSNGDGTETVELETDLPTHVVGSPYTIAVNESGEDRVELTTHDPVVTVSVPYRTSTGVDGTTVTGGSLVIEYDADRERLVVRDD